MRRYFAIIAGINMLIILLSSATIYWLNDEALNSAQQTNAQQQLQNSVNLITTRTQLLRDTLQNLSQSPDLMAALNRNDFNTANAIVQRMRHYLPQTMALRLLLPKLQEPDTSSVPHLGYADIDLVRSTFSAAQKPVVQGEQGPNRHLAITQAIGQQDQPRAVLLASLELQYLQSSLQSLTEPSLYAELIQTESVLASHGNSALKNAATLHSLDIANTHWKINYWYASAHQDSDLSTLCLVTIATALLLSALAGFLGWQKLRATLENDQRSVLKAAKDLLMGKGTHGNYPIILTEMNTLISTLVQFKRVLDQGDQITKTPIPEPDDRDLFLDEPSEFLSVSSNFSVFEQTRDNLSSTGQSVTKLKTGAALSLVDSDAPPQDDPH